LITDQHRTTTTIQSLEFPFRIVIYILNSTIIFYVERKMLNMLKTAALNKNSLAMTFFHLKLAVPRFIQTLLSLLKVDDVPNSLEILREEKH
jgi:hypothetical protein